MEPIENQTKMIVYDITNSVVNDYKNNLIKSMWNAEEATSFSQMDKDLQQITTQLNEQERQFLIRIHLYFLLGDSCVVMVGYGTILRRITHSSIHAHECIKIGNEVVHAETYVRIIDFIAPNEKEEFLKNGHKHPYVMNKIAWTKKYALDDENMPLGKVFLSMIITELLFFSASFASIFWFRNTKEILYGISAANELIFRDESQHGECYIYIYNHLIINKLQESEVHDMIRDAVEVECAFVDEIAPQSIGMNAVLLNDYVMYIADTILTSLHYNKIYHKQNPFNFMATVSLSRRTDNFRKNPTDYRRVENKIFDFKEISDDEMYLI